METKKPEKPETVVERFANREAVDRECIDWLIRVDKAVNNSSIGINISMPIHPDDKARWYRTAERHCRTKAETIEAQNEKLGTPDRVVRK